MCTKNGGSAESQQLPELAEAHDVT